MLKRIHITGYKTLRDANIELGSLIVCLGANSTGKSNLFDVLQLLARMTTCRTLSQAFEQQRGLPREAFSDMDDEGSTRGRGAAQLSIEAEVELSEASVQVVERRIAQIREDALGRPSTARSSRGRVRERKLRYRLTVELSPTSGLLRVADERLAALNIDGSETRRRAPFIEKVRDKLRLRPDHQGRPSDYDLGLDYALISQPFYPPHYPHIAAFKEELFGWRCYRLEPSALSSRTPPSELFHLQCDGAGLAAFFHTLISAGAEPRAALNRMLAALPLGLQQLRVETGREGLLQLKFLERGAWRSAPALSEGILRIVGLMAIAHPSARSTLIACEEPENGVHSGRYKLLADLLRGAAERGAQVLINTHAPAFAAHFDDQQLLICRRRAGGTEYSRFTSSAPLMRASELEAAMAG